MAQQAETTVAECSLTMFHLCVYMNPKMAVLPAFRRLLSDFKDSKCHVIDCTAGCDVGVGKRTIEQVFFFF